MRKLVLFFVIAASASCGNGSSDAANTDSVVTDSLVSTPVVPTDTTGATIMNADTTGMGQAR